jgi:hypothetical protein
MFLLQQGNDRMGRIRDVVALSIHGRVPFSGKSQVDSGLIVR